MKKIKLHGRAEKSIFNAFSSIISQIIIILLNFLTRTVFVHTLSVEYLGVNGLFAGLLTVLSFAELGIGEAMVFAMYRPMKEKNEEQLCRLMNFYKITYRCIASVIGILGVVLSFFINHLVKNKITIDINLQLIFLLYLSNTVVSYLMTYKKSILLVSQKRYIIVSYQLGFSILQLILQVIILKVYKDFVLFLLIQILCTFMGNYAITTGINKKFPFLINGNLSLSKEDRLQILTNVQSLSITKIAGIVGNSTGTIIISKMIGIGVVGLLSNYTLIINGINGLLWALLNGITNSIGDFNVDSTIDRRRIVFDQLYLCSFWVFAVFGISIICLINPFIELWIGNAYILDKLVTFALVLSVFIGGLNYPAYSYRISLGIFKQVNIFYIAYAILNLVLSISWAQSIGLVGVFLATSVSRLCTAEIADGYYVYKTGLNRNPLRYFIRDIISIIAFILILLIVTKILSFIKVVGITGLILKTIVCVVFTNIIIFLIVFKSITFRCLVDRIKRLISR